MFFRFCSRGGKWKRCAQVCLASNPQGPNFINPELLGTMLERLRVACAFGEDAKAQARKLALFGLTLNSGGLTTLFVNKYGV